jgi:DENN (AEX-3) domain
MVLVLYLPWEASVQALAVAYMTHLMRRLCKACIIANNGSTHCCSCSIAHPTSTHCTLHSIQYYVCQLCMTATGLLYPFEWPHSLVPALPPGLEHYLQVPMPFLMGMSIAHLHSVTADLSSVVIVNLEADRYNNFEGSFSTSIACS